MKPGDALVARFIAIRFPCYDCGEMNIYEVSALLLACIGAAAFWLDWRMAKAQELTNWRIEKQAKQSAELEKSLTIHGNKLQDLKELRRSQQSDTTELHARIAEMRKATEQKDSALLEASMARDRAQEGMRDDLGQYVENLIAVEITAYEDRLKAVEEALKIKQEVKPHKKQSVPFSQARASAEAGEARIRMQAEEKERARAENAKSSVN